MDVPLKQKIKIPAHNYTNLLLIQYSKNNGQWSRTTNCCEYGRGLHNIPFRRKEFLFLLARNGPLIYIDWRCRYYVLGLTFIQSLPGAFLSMAFCVCRPHKTSSTFDSNKVLGRVGVWSGRLRACWQLRRSWLEKWNIHRYQQKHYTLQVNLKLWDNF